MDIWLSYARFLVPLGFLLIVLGVRLFLSRSRSLIRALALHHIQGDRVRGQLTDGTLISISSRPPWAKKNTTPVLVGELPHPRFVLRPRKAGEGPGPVPTGDAHFDARWWLEGDPLPLLTALTAPHRALLCQLHSSGLTIERAHFFALTLDPTPVAQWVYLFHHLLPALSQTRRTIQAESLARITQEDPDAHVRTRAFELMLENSLTTRKFLQQAAHSEVPPIRVNALIALGTEPALETQLITMLEDEKSRSAAISGLTRIGTPRSVMPLRALGATQAVAAIQARLGTLERGALEIAQVGGDLELVSEGGELSLVDPDQTKQNISE